MLSFVFSSYKTVLLTPQLADNLLKRRNVTKKNVPVISILKKNKRMC